MFKRTLKLKKKILSKCRLQKFILLYNFLNIVFWGNHHKYLEFNILEKDLYIKYVFFRSYLANKNTMGDIYLYSKAFNRLNGTSKDKKPKEIQIYNRPLKYRTGGISFDSRMKA